MKSKILIFIVLSLCLPACIPVGSGSKKVEFWNEYTVESYLEDNQIEPIVENAEGSSKAVVDYIMHNDRLDVDAYTCLVRMSARTQPYLLSLYKNNPKDESQFERNSKVLYLLGEYFKDFSLFEDWYKDLSVFKDKRIFVWAIEHISILLSTEFKAPPMVFFKDRKIILNPRFKNWHEMHRFQ